MVFKLKVGLAHAITNPTEAEIDLVNAQQAFTKLLNEHCTFTWNQMSLVNDYLCIVKNDTCKTSTEENLNVVRKLFE